MVVSESSPEPKTEDTAAAQAAAGPRCRSCGTPLTAGQEWCLECGSARTANRWRSGRRPLLLTAGLTISLLGVAVAASYAAIVDNPSIPSTATVPAPPPQVAAAPPTTDAAPPADSTSQDLAPVDTSTDVAPSAPDTPVTPPAVDNTTTGTTTTTTTTTTTNTTTTTKKDTTPKPTPVKLTGDDASLYDPLQHQLAPDGGDPSAAIGDDSTAWIVQTDPALPRMDVGLLLTLPKKSTVGELTFKTSTPGFTVQVYGSFESDLPTDVTDSRWAYLRTRKDVDGSATKDDNKAGDGKERITLSDDGSQYKLIMLWVTKAPSSGPPAKLSAVKLFK
jgi:hypothetical protein